jgi:F-type H+-transporting ATPase subunit b
MIFSSFSTRPKAAERAGNLMRKQIPQARVALMISLDWSIIPALIIFILTVVALNFLLLKPVTRIQEEREMRTTGLMSQTQRDLAHHLHLFDQYQATIKKGRIEGYRLMEKARSEALLHRGAALEAAKRNAEQLTQQARDSIQGQVAEARTALEREAREIAGRIVSIILRRSA